MWISWQKEIQEKLASVFYDGRVAPRHTKDEHFYEDVEDGEVYPSVTTKTGILGKHYLKQWAVNQTIDHLELHIDKLIEADDPFTVIDIIHDSKYAHVNRLEEAAMWGTHGHDLVDVYVTKWIKENKRPTENILDFAPADISNQGKWVALSACKFFDEYTLFPLASELKVLSKKHKYAGTLDSLWLVGEKLYKGREGDKNCQHDWYEKKKDVVHCMKCGREEKLAIVLIDLKSSNQIMNNISYAAQVTAYANALREMANIRTKKQWVLQLDKHKSKYTIGQIIEPVKMFQFFVLLNKIDQFSRLNLPSVIPLEKKKRIIL